MKSPENLIKLIMETFANISNSAKEQLMPCTCDECKEVKEKISMIANENWNDISEDFIEENYDCLPLLTPEMFHFLLPAFLTYTLKHFDSGYKVSGFTLSTLCPNKDWEKNKSWWKNRFKNFSSSQLELVFSFLDLAFNDEGFENDRVSIEKGKRRLEMILRSEE